ncbi:YfhO family protein [Patescibacteria group bacterium]|nr:YfhO family protein [Patescibacteria group bacterium]
MTILFAFFYKPIIYGLSIVPAGVLYNMDNIYRGFNGKINTLPKNVLLTDLVYQMYPWYQHTIESISHFSIPLWNPYSLTGLPFLANSQSSIFEITKLLSYIFTISEKDFMLFSGFITLFLAGYFTYIYCLNLKLGVLGSITSSLAFIFSGPMIVWLGYPLVSTFIWLPLILLSIDKIFQKNSLSWVTILSFSIGFQFFGGNPEISWFVLLLCAIYTIFNILRQLFLKIKRKKIFHKSILVVISLFLGLMIASVQLIPTTEFLLQSSEMKKGRTGLAESNFFEIMSHEWNGWSNITEVKNSLENAILIVFPDFFGNPSTGSYWGAGNFSETALYIGIIPLVFALISIISIFQKNQKRENKYNILFWASIGFSSFLIYASFPFFRLVAYLPVFNILIIGRLRFIFVFAMAILAGYGVNYFINKKWNFLNKIKVFNIIYISIILFTIVSAYLWLKYAFTSIPLEIVREKIIYLIILSILLNLVISVLVLYKSKSFENNLAKGVLVILIIIELFSYGQKYHPAIEKKYIYPSTPAIEYLQNNSENFRFTSYKITVNNFITSMSPNSNLVWKLQDIRGYEIIKPQRYEEFERHFGGYTYNFFSHKVFDLLGVKYFVQSISDVENDILAEDQNLDLVYSDKQINIYENKGVLPRTFIVYNLAFVDNHFEAVEKFLADSFDPRFQAIVESKNDEMEKFVNQTKTEYVPAEITSYLPEKMKISTDSKRDGFLVLTDSFYVGWKAYLDEEEVTIYPTDVAFRGVYIPKGKHEIIFSYEPQSFQYSMYLSLFGIFSCLSLLIIDKIKLKKYKSG